MIVHDTINVQNATLVYFKMINFMFCEFYHNKNKNPEEMKSSPKVLSKGQVHISVEGSGGQDPEHHFPSPHLWDDSVGEGQSPRTMSLSLELCPLIGKLPWPHRCMPKNMKC